MKQIVLFLALAGFASGLWADRPNVLMIISDDLNDWVSHLGGHEPMKTPNIDRIAAMGVTFSQGHTMAPQCNPSRNAFFTGEPPFVSGIYQNGNQRTDEDNHRKSLFRYFRQQGYYVAGAGKIIGGETMEGSMDVFLPRGRANRNLLMEKDLDAVQDWGMFPDTPEGDAAVEDYSTVQFVTEALETDLVAEHDKPFFLIAGLYKPHVPLFVPKRFYDMYPLDEIQFPEILDSDLDDIDMEAFCKLARCGEQTTRGLTDKEIRETIRAYMATVSYTDENVGKILDAFEDGPNAKYADNTIIVFWSDHGYHLGEKERVMKRTLWNESTRSPYLWVVPGVTTPGAVCEHPVDFSNAYATLCDLAGLDLPEWVSNRKSMRPILKDAADPDWDGFAVSTYVEGNHSIYTNEGRFIRYSTNAPSSWEYYDEQADPNEWHNLLYGKLRTMADFKNSDDPAVQKARELNRRLDAYLAEMKGK